MDDAEAMVIAFLQERIPDVDIASKVPNPRPRQFLRVWRSGGIASNRIVDNPHLTISGTVEPDDEGAGSVDASELTQRARTLIFEESSGMPLVREVREVVGFRSDPDPDTDADRYTFTVALRVRKSH